MTGAEFAAAKAWLNRGYNIDQEIQTLLKAKEIAWGDCLRMTAAPADDVRSAPTNARKDSQEESALLQVERFDTMINDRIDTLYQIKCEVAKAAMAAKDSRHAALLVARYVNFASWYKIAAQLNYSEDYVRKELHREAVDAVAQYIPSAQITD